LKIESDKTGDVPTTISYLTRDLSWQGSYICVLDEDQSTLSLQGQITLVNQCGLDFTGATVRFVAGDVNQVAPKYYDTLRAAPMAAMETGTGEQSAFEYHLYTLPGTIDLASGDALVVPYAKASAVAVHPSPRGRYAYSEMPTVRSSSWGRTRSITSRDVPYYPAQSQGQGCFDRCPRTSKRNVEDNQRVVDIPREERRRGYICHYRATVREGRFQHDQVRSQRSRRRGERGRIHR